MGIFDNFFLPHYFGPFAYPIGVLLMILALNVIIFIHELGHFLAAKSVKLPVPVFAIGFGPSLFKWKWKETEFSFNAILLGGYIALAEDIKGDGTTIPDEHKFNLRPIWQRMWVTVAGVVFNFLLAIIVMMMVVSIDGTVTKEDLIVGNVLPNSPAIQAGIMKDDKIIAVNGKPVNLYRDMIFAFQANKHKQISVTVKRGDTEKTLLATPNNDGRLLMEIQRDFSKYKVYPHNPIEMAQMAVYQTNDMLHAIMTGLWQVVTGQISLLKLNSPVMVVKIGADVAQSNLSGVLFLVAFISIDIGLMNLLPLPALDGGRLFFLMGELIARKPLPTIVEIKIHQVGFALLMTLGLFIITKDIYSLITGITF